MSRIFDALANSRAVVPRGSGLPAARPPAGLPGAVAAADLPLLRLWQALEARLAGRLRKVVQIAACAEGETDPSVAMRLARLAGRAMGGGVVVLRDGCADEEEDGSVVYGPLPGRGGDARAFNPDLLRAYWQRLGERADLILLDTPPVLASPLAQAVAPTVDGVVLLLEAERTRVDVARAARDLLAGSGATVMGTVLNKRRLHVPAGLYRRL